MMTKGGPVAFQRLLLSFAMSFALHANPSAEIEKRIDALLAKMTLR
jgi:hypothetical protein